MDMQPQTTLYSLRSALTSQSRTILDTVVFCHNANSGPRTVEEYFAAVRILMNELNFIPSQQPANSPISHLAKFFLVALGNQVIAHQRQTPPIGDPSPEPTSIIEVKTPQPLDDPNTDFKLV